MGLGSGPGETSLPLCHRSTRIKGTVYNNCTTMLRYAKCWSRRHGFYFVLQLKLQVDKFGGRRANGKLDRFPLFRRDYGSSR